jgi:DNA-binding LacI/PurR family transcriptional regulator
VSSIIATDERVNELRMTRAVPPRRPPTLEDVAARAGVSRALVSIVVRGVPGASDATRERVRKIAAELGYRPDSRARLLAGRQSRLLGVTLVLNHPFHADLAEGIYAAAEPLGYEVVLSAVTAHRDPRRAIGTLLDYRCAAAILVGSLVREPELSALGEGLPVVVVGQRARSSAVDVVRTDDAEGMRLAVDHLVHLGHRDIAHVDGARSPGAAERRTGYRSAMRRNGLADHIHVVAGGPAEEDGAAAARTLIDAGPPSAALTYNDRCAVGLLDVFIRAGIAVPDDISVVGYDDSQVTRLPYVRLTSVSQDAAHLARLAVHRALARLAHEDVTPREVVLSPQLVVRATTAPPRHR